MNSLPQCTGDAQIAALFAFWINLVGTPVLYGRSFCIMTSSHTTFSKETFEAFRSTDRDGPVQLLNLIKLRDTAVYEDKQQRSGREAYASYGKISAPVFAAAGGRIVWRGNWELGMIGPSSEQWDVCFIAEYPSVKSFVDMLKNPIYREAMTHRIAAVEDSRLIRYASAAPGSTFHGA